MFVEDINKMRQYLKEQYSILKDNSDVKVKTNTVYNICYVKVDNKEFLCHERSLYSDIKEFIKLYIENLDNYDFGYDQLNVEKLNIINLLAPKERIAMIKYSERLAHSHGYEIEWLQKQIPIAKRAICADRFLHPKSHKLSLIEFIFNILQWIRLLVTRNLFSLILTLILFFISISVFLLPAPFEWMEFFSIDYYDYNKDFITNHILNIANYLIGINSDDTSVRPMNVGGFIFFTTFKLLFFVVIVDFIIKNILKRISIYDK